VTRRVPPLLVMSNTIFDVARRGKTLLVTPNINAAAGNVSLPRSKHETKGGIFSSNQPSPPHSKHERQHVQHGNNTTHRSNTTSVNKHGNTNSPPSLKMRVGGDILSTTTLLLEMNNKQNSCPPPPLPCLKQLIGKAFTPTITTPLLEMNDKWHSRPPPSLHGQNSKDEHLCSILGFRLLLVPQNH
jgi:hypothetical protein